MLLKQKSGTSSFVFFSKVFKGMVKSHKEKKQFFDCLLIYKSLNKYTVMQNHTQKFKLLKLS